MTPVNPWAREACATVECPVCGKSMDVEKLDSAEGDGWQPFVSKDKETWGAYCSTNCMRAELKAARSRFKE